MGLGAHPASACRLYCAEVDRAGGLSEQLGLGIAAFQGLSNLALNGERGPWGRWCHGAGSGGAVGQDPHHHWVPPPLCSPQALYWEPSLWVAP